MIFGRNRDAAAYRGIHPRLDRALECLTDEFLASVGTETQKLEGDALYVTRFDYDTVPFEETFYESHKKYLDVHVMVKGSERVDIANPETLTLDENKGDFYGYHGEAEQSVLLRPGDFLVVFPGDAHRLKIAPGRPEPVSKVVFKIQVYE